LIRGRLPAGLWLVRTAIRNLSYGSERRTGANRLPKERIVGERTTSTELIAEGVTKAYPAPHGELVVLRDVHLRLCSGDAVAITGPSGSGKSTLLNILGGLDHPTRGRVRLDGQDLGRLSDRELARVRNRSVGFVFQDHHLLPHCSALENVLVPTLAAGGTTPELEDRARLLLDLVGLADRMDHLPAELSGGERQRVALARALIGQPAVVLCDEPTGNLDRHSAHIVADLLVDLHRRTRTILVVVTHSTELAARLPRRFELCGGVLESAAPP
jgi:lipoprotein-releasing system ATP-binding protein